MTKPDAPKPDTIKQTARERAERETRDNPQCTEAPKSGQGFIIGGGRRAWSRGSSDLG